nr:immunoglobulin light chain junction region [Macaca mulatta]
DYYCCSFSTSSPWVF